MNENELNAILHSDMKLWEAAEDVPSASGITKKLELPYGIGPFEITFEGISNAEERRAALVTWGVHVRGAIEEAVGDEAVTARAAQSPARLREEASRDVGGANTDGVRNQVPQASGQEAVATPNVFALGPEAVRDRVDEINSTIRRLRAELAGLNAYLEVMDAQPIQREESPSVKEQVDGCDSGELRRPARHRARDLDAGDFLVRGRKDAAPE